MDVHRFATRQASVFGVIPGDIIKKASLWDMFRGVILIMLSEGRPQHHSLHLDIGLDRKEKAGWAHTFPVL